MLFFLISLHHLFPKASGLYRSSFQNFTVEFDVRIFSCHLTSNLYFVQIDTQLFKLSLLIVSARFTGLTLKIFKLHKFAPDNYE